MLRRDWRNVTLISTVGLVNGIGWSICQNWKWAPGFWPDAHFNFWRCWESCGGISIGLAYGIAYYLTNRPLGNRAFQPSENTANLRPNLERFGVYLGLILGLGLALKNGLKGWANIYLGNEKYWNHLLWQIIGPLMLLAVIAVMLRIRFRPLPPGYDRDVFPNANRLIWLVVIWQNVIAQLVTGPRSVWNEMAFKIYYVFLFLISAVILIHYQFQRSQFLNLSESTSVDHRAQVAS